MVNKQILQSRGKKLHLVFFKNFNKWDPNVSNFQNDDVVCEFEHLIVA